MNPEAYAEWLFSTTLIDPLQTLFQVLDEGTIKKITPEKLVVTTPGGIKFILKGDLETDPVVSGTLDSVKLKVNGVKIFEGGDFIIDAGELKAIVESPNDPGEFLGNIINQIGTYKGSQQADEFPRITGDGIVIKGRGGDDVLRGGEGQQKLKGGKGNDTLIGDDFGGGIEKLGGDPKPDKLFGGKGLDTFVFAVGSSLAKVEGSYHKIKDFSHKDDTILIETSVIPAGFLDPDAFVVGEVASSPDHRIIYDEANGDLYVDIDGDGLDAVQFKFAEVVPGTKIKANDFVIEGFFGLQ
ncbi:hypothetical protein [Bauldia sp.]|uniref:hypothetical protein n=1 Tax=Bauldia sp. TaxID=2575872 RepID=UPI003BAA05FC